MYRWKNPAWQSAHRTSIVDYSELPPRKQWIPPSAVSDPRIRIEYGSWKYKKKDVLRIKFVKLMRPHLFFFSQSNSWRRCSMSFGFPVDDDCCWQILLLLVWACFGSQARLDEEWWLCLLRWVPELGWQFLADIVLFVSTLVLHNRVKYEDYLSCYTVNGEWARAKLQCRVEPFCFRTILSIN